MIGLLDCSEEKLIGAEEKEENIKLAPGTFLSTLIEVNEAPGWAPGKAVELVFQVEVSEGKFVEKKSTMVCSTKNPRTKEFVTYLKKSNVTFKYFEELIGLQEMLTFMYDDVNGHRYLNILSREFVSMIDNA